MSRVDHDSDKAIELVTTYIEKGIVTMLHISISALLRHLEEGLWAADVMDHFGD